MSSPLKQRADGLVQLTPAADYTNHEGYGMTWTGDVCTVSASATTQIRGVIVVGGTVAQGVTLAVLGATNGAINFKLGGAVTRGDKLCQHTDGTFITDAGTGARVMVAIADQSGVAGDLIRGYPITPITGS
jgi:hypothetical protein